ncbi:MAG: alpha/beta hydrolase [Ruminococcaceae bacterium]|nr:alpha/beta hydrolase [Oscillospiraceae bacterium]
MPGLWISMGVIAALLVATLGIAYWCYRQAFYFSDADKHVDPRRFFGAKNSEFCHRPMLELVDALEAVPFERVCITSRDGLRLYGRLYRFSERNRVEILFHGWRSSGIRDASGGAKIARDTGYNLLIVDQRAHGDSEGNTITFGILEKYDCIDWVRFVVSRFGEDVQILLGGVSMGAATVFMAAGLDELPPQVVAVTGDCGYSSPEAIIRKVCRDRGIPDRLGYPFLALGARLFGHFSLKDGGAVEAVTHTKIPVMIMHGEADDFVPFEMCREIYNACASEKKLLAIPNAGHGLAYFYDTDRYVSEVAAFKKQAFK